MNYRHRQGPLTLLTGTHVSDFDVRCRANSAQIRQSGPNQGLVLGHWADTSLDPLNVCPPCSIAGWQATSPHNFHRGWTPPSYSVKCGVWKPGHRKEKARFVSPWVHTISNHRGFWRACSGGVRRRHAVISGSRNEWFTLAAGFKLWVRVAIVLCSAPGHSRRRPQRDFSNEMDVNDPYGRG